MGAKITTEIDPYIKQIFETLRDKLKVSYKEILEEGILQRVKSIDPIRAEEIEVMQLEFKLSAKKTNLATLKANAAYRIESTIVPQQTNGIEAERQEWFLRLAPKINQAIKTGDPNWERLTKRGPFTKTKECKEWVLNHLPEWRHRHED